MGLPGTEIQIRRTIENIFGAKKARLFWQKYYESYITEADFLFLKSLNFNTIRIPINHNHFLDNDLFQDGLNNLNRLLKLCEKHKIYAVLDLHTAPGGQNPDWHSDNSAGESLLWVNSNFQEQVIKIWNFISQIYKNNPWVLGYDILNEPCLETTEISKLNSLYKKIITTIRKNDAEHFIIIEGNNYARFFQDLDFIDDDKLMYSFHYYPLFDFEQYQTADPSKLMQKNCLGDLSIEELKQKFKAPLWCGETGFPIDNKPYKKQLALLDNFLNILEENYIYWSLWNYKSAKSMGLIMAKENSAWLKVSQKILKNWTIWQDFKQAQKAAEKYCQSNKIIFDDKLLYNLKYRFMAMNQLSLINNLFSRRFPNKIISIISF